MMTSSYCHHALLNIVIATIITIATITATDTTPSLAQLTLFYVT